MDGLDLDKIDSASLEDLDTVLETGTVPDSLKVGETDTTPDATVEDETVLVAEPVLDEVETASTSTVTDTPAPDVTALEKRVSEFSFTENASPEVVIAEETEYRQLVELPTPFEQMIVRRDSEIQRLSNLPVMDKVAEEHMTAFNHLASQYVKVQGDNGEDEWLPDTAPALALFERVYPKEFGQMMVDRLSQQSKKYPNWSVMYEIIKDQFGLTEQSLETINTVLENGGYFPRPEYLPEGIDRKFLDAYWYSVDRDKIEGERERALAIWYDKDATPAEKALAKQTIGEINQKLAREQRMAEAERAEALKQRQEKVDLQVYAVNEGNKAYEKTITGFIRNSAADLATQLEPLAGPAAKGDAFGFCQLIINAFSDVDEFGRLAQEQIDSLGIKISWADAKKQTQLLYESECKIKYLEKINANPRAIQIETENKDKVLRALTALDKTIKGQYIALKVKGSGEAIKKKITAAPVVNEQNKVVVRPKVRATSGTTPNSPVIDWNNPASYAHMDPDEIQRMLDAEVRAQARAGVRA